MTYEHLLPERSEPGNFPACFAFSIHKCGSSLMHAMIKDVCHKESIPSLDIPTPMFNEGIGEEWKNDDVLIECVSEGYIFYGFRDFPQFLRRQFDFSKSRNVLLVRDPRDALVSQYFSFRPGGSHVLPKRNAEKFLSREGDSENESIDEYVKKNAENLKQKFESYYSLIDSNHVRVYRYEDIFFDKEAFLRSIFQEFGVDVPDDIVKSVAQRHDIRPKHEDMSKHIRKGLPGDYREKLQGETKEFLDDRLREILMRFGYGSDDRSRIRDW